MYKLINEISGAVNPRLTDIQKSVLLLSFSAPTPQLAFEDANGSEYITSARDFLYRVGLITIGQNSIKITSDGYQSLIENGLIDETDQITEIGKELLDKFNQMRIEISEAAIPYRVFRSILNASSNN